MDFLFLVLIFARRLGALSTRGGERAYGEVLVIYGELARSVRCRCTVLGCGQAFCLSPSFIFYFFTATRSFALRDRGL